MFAFDVQFHNGQWAHGDGLAFFAGDRIFPHLAGLPATDLPTEFLPGPEELPSIRYAGDISVTFSGGNGEYSGYTLYNIETAEISRHSGVVSVPNTRGEYILRVEAGWSGEPVGDEGRVPHSALYYFIRVVVR
jgi:hypothetical protein